MNSFPQLVFTVLASECASSICRGQFLVPALDTWLVKGEEPGHLQCAAEVVTRMHLRQITIHI